MISIMLEHGPIKIENEDRENALEKVTNYYKGQHIQDGHKVTTGNEDDLLEIEEKASVWIGRVEAIKYIESSKISKSSKNAKTNRYLENKNNCEENEKSENEINSKKVTISRRQRNDITCNKVSMVYSDKEDARFCGNICAFNRQQKLIFNCKFCDKNYGDINNFKSHLHEDHKMFNLENAPRILRKRIGLLKDQQNQKLKLEHKPETSTTAAPVDYCGKVFILNHREMCMVCGSCETDYNSFDLFEKHLRQEHQSFESFWIKSEASSETVNTAETYESHKGTLNLTQPLKLDKETVSNTVQPTTNKRSATKRKCTIKNNENQQKVSTRPDSKLEPDLYQITPQKTQIDKRCRRTIKATTEKKSLPGISQEEPIPEIISSRDQINEEFLLKQLYEEQIPKIIVKTVGKRFKCNECEKQFIKLTKLNEHKQRHFKDKKYKCTLCELAYFNKKELSKHMRHHSTGRRYKCAQCSKGFERNSDLKIHVRVHTGEKPFVCDICNKCFRAKQNLSVHRKSHMGEASKTYECEHCDKKFIRNIDRKIHIRSHTGEKPYKCEICQRGFSSKFNVQAHIDRDHTLPNGLRKPPKGRKKPGPKPKPLTDELAKQKKLIEKLQQQLLEQIKSDKKILTTEDETPLQKTSQVKYSTSTTSHDQLKNAYDLLSQITSTVMPLLNL